MKDQNIRRQYHHIKGFVRQHTKSMIAFVIILLLTGTFAFANPLRTALMDTKLIQVAVTKVMEVFGGSSDTLKTIKEAGEVISKAKEISDNVGNITGKVDSTLTDVSETTKTIKEYVGRDEENTKVKERIITETKVLENRIKVYKASNDKLSASIANIRSKHVKRPTNLVMETQSGSEESSGLEKTPLDKTGVLMLQEFQGVYDGMLKGEQK